MAIRRVVSHRVVSRRAGDETEWEGIIAEQLEPNSGDADRWPLSAKQTFAIAMALTREKRDETRPSRRRPGDVAELHDEAAATD